MAQRTLISLAIVFTVLAFFVAEADFWSGHHSLEHFHYESTGLTSFRIAHAGEIELDVAQRGIERMSPDAFLEVRERRFTSRRRLEVRPDTAGAPTFFFKRGARKQTQEEAEEYLASIMGEIVRSTTVGARSRAQRLLTEQGLDELLREVRHLDTNAGRRIYVEVAAGLEGLESPQAEEIVQVAGREITSSSRLRATLVDLAQEWPAEWSLTAPLTRAAENIASSSEKATALVEIVRERSLEPGDEAAIAEALATIPSTGERARAIVRIHRLERGPELAVALLEAADTMQSSGERRRVLEELVDTPGLPESFYSRALDVGSRIASSGEKASFLSTTASVMPEADALRLEYLGVAETISSSGEGEKAMMALMNASDLPESVCRAWVESAGEVASSGDAADLLVHGAGRCPGSFAVWRSFLRSVENIPSSGDKVRALMALLDRDDLEEQTLTAIVDVTDRTIPSTSDREIVLARVDQRRRDLVARPSPDPVDPATTEAAPQDPEAGDEPEPGDPPEGG